jgi:hypothetical protein
VNVLLISKRSLNLSVIRAPSRRPTFWLRWRVPSRSETLVGNDRLAIGRIVTVWAWRPPREIGAAAAPRSRKRTLVCRSVARTAILILSMVWKRM